MASPQVTEKAFIAESSKKTTSESSASTDSDKLKGYGLKATHYEPLNHNTTSPATDKIKTSIPYEDDNKLTRPHTMTMLGGRIKLRARDDDDPSDWWFASTAIPLLAATFAPMANLLSIAALVVFWRNTVTTPDVPTTKHSLSVGKRDPDWCLNLNGASLACGFVGNIFLLCNFTKKIRYIIALPITIFLFYLASGILIGILVAMKVYDPPLEGEVYSQGYWHAVIAACLYMGNAILLMINMLGYFLGHYPQHFDLNDEQRNLILQTMIFFIWLGGGAGVFAQLEGFPGAYSDALYFCDVTLLTIGFGDFYPTDDAGRGLVFPYTVGGTIILGLMVSSIHKFARELSKEKVLKQRVETRRINTLRRAVTVTEDASSPNLFGPMGTRPIISRPMGGDQIQSDLYEKAKLDKIKGRTPDSFTPDGHDFADAESGPSPSQFRFKQGQQSKPLFRTLTLERVISLRRRMRVLLPSRNQKAILMRNEKDRFDKMRDIQYAAKGFKKWYALTMSVISFGLLWCVGAVVFYKVESETQGLSYFQALYFCYVSLLTIGYGDLSPKSNAGKSFFVFWSLVAVPTMTILVSDLGDTAIGGFKRKVLEFGGLALLGKGRGWGLDWFVRRKEGFQRRLSMVGISHEKAGEIESGQDDGVKAPRLQQDLDEAKDAYERSRPPKTIDELLDEDLSESEMTRRLAYALQRVADDLKNYPDKRYSYEEWVEFSRLIKFSRLGQIIRDSGQQLEYDEAVDGLIEWDWLDSNSPMASEQTEAEFVLDRLLESLVRTFRKGDILARLALADNETDRMLSALNGARPSASFAKAEKEDEDDSVPHWSKRGMARHQLPETGSRHRKETIASARMSEFRAAAGFHGRMKPTKKKTLGVFQRRPMRNNSRSTQPT